MKRLLLATTNPAKLGEYRILMRDVEIELASLADLGIDSAPEENGTTFAENAMLKARFYFERSGLTALADDGGLEVDALGGAPGVRSHRWLGEDGSDDHALAHEVVRRMSGVPEKQRSARLRAAAALVWREAGQVRSRVVEAALEGIIAPRVYERIQPGFPYRAVLFLPERGRYLGELNDEEAAQLSQRRAALAALRDTLGHLAQIA